MRKSQRARYVYLTLFVVSVMCTPVPAADHAHTQGQKHGMEKMDHKDHKPMQMEMANEGIFEGTGEVIALVPDKSQIVVKHQEIAGFMAAMTMGYAVEPASLLDDLKPGDVVTFKIDAAKKKIIAIETTP